jgi:hypothetical protein
LDAGISIASKYFSLSQLKTEKNPGIIWIEGMRMYPRSGVLQRSPEVIMISA